jgi:5-formyltetrahydrofolate cyclo-ligase
MPHDAPHARADTPTGGALREAKRVLRESVLAHRDALPAAARHAAEARIIARIMAMPAFTSASHLLMTLPFRGEWDTRALIEAAHAAGKRVVLPRVDERAKMLELFAVSDLAQDVAPGYRGIDEPRAHCAPVAVGAIDWVLVPGVAFDCTGRRLGYGGGFYDRLLPLVDARAPRVSGAFDLQIVERVPAAPHDLAVDIVVTETRSLRR